MRYVQAYLDVIDQTEETDRTSRSASIEETFFVGEEFSVQSHQVYQEGFGHGGYHEDSRPEMDSDANYSELNSLKVATHQGSYKAMRKCGLLSRNAIR